MILKLLARRRVGDQEAVRIVGEIEMPFLSRLRSANHMQIWATQN